MEILLRVLHRKVWRVLHGKVGKIFLGALVQESGEEY